VDLGGREHAVRTLARTADPVAIGDTVIATSGGTPVRLSDVAELRRGVGPMRGDAGVNGRPAVVLSVQKQPGADTRRLTDEVTRALDELRPALPADIRLNPALYQQKTFIDLSIRNVLEALRDGGILVVIVLFLFLLNFRTTFITLTAIPLSIVITGLVFKWLGMSINTMTLGGLAVAIGELVDDAIVDVENIFRRLRENGGRGNSAARRPRPRTPRQRRPGRSAHRRGRGRGAGRAARLGPHRDGADALRH
jgi:HME family heavy-metal exporter